MSGGHIALLVLACLSTAVTVYYVGRAVRRRRRRRVLRAAPLPVEWQEILLRNLPPYRHLTKALQKDLQGDMNVFLDEKSFEGCGGLELTDEIRVTIAGQACLLILNRDAGWYPRLDTILVYPSTYVAQGRGAHGDVGNSVRLGESWDTGAVVLAWDSVKRGALNFDDGHNVTLHEFAHQLDQEDGNADGAPILEQRSAYRSWARILSGEYKRLIKRSKRGRRSVMDDYGATNPAEFFAVATETFFEEPEQLAKKRPELFDELKGYYHLDPREWG
jgi:Mlc titration factor MtfA (ptsG expression regulator)